MIVDFFPDGYLELGKRTGCYLTMQANNVIAGG